MAALPGPLNTTVNAVYAAIEAAAKEEHRLHLGASIIGKSCERSIWYTFRWAQKKHFDGRMQLLFGTGHLEERRIIDNLRKAGIEIHDVGPDGGQWEVRTLGGHFGGSMDGAGLKFPEAPKTWHVLEVKTSNQKRFDEMQKLKVKKAKPQHWAQMQVYMGETGMDRAMYIMKNKNTDELYNERVEFDPVAYAKLKAKAERIIRASEPPLRISADPSWYECKMCDFHSLCHGTVAPEVNCRTCAHSTPVIMPGEEKGPWVCGNVAEGALGVVLDEATQRNGCTAHRFIPIMLENFAKPADYVNGDVVYDCNTGGKFANGEQPGSFSSQEIRACAGKATLPDMVPLKAAFKTARCVA
jgi:hypothetical protein